MTQERHDPWALLREARESLDKASRSSWDTEVVGDVAGTRNRIDAAFAAHDAVPPSEEKVEWQTDAFGNDYVKQGNVLSMVAKTLDGNWGWETRVEGYADTEAEAQRAAIAAARRMK